MPSLASAFVEEGAVYGRKPPKPGSAWLLTRDIRERSTDSKVEVIDMGKDQEYEFRFGEAAQWPRAARKTGAYTLKDHSWDGWWRLYLARRRKYHSKPDGKYIDALGEAAKKAVPMDFETFAAKRGGSRLDYGEPGVHKRSRRQSDKQWNRILKHLAQKDIKLSKLRSDLQKEYDALVKQGVLRPTTRLERLKDAAAGHPDNLSVQAARRILKKLGVEWRLGEAVEKRADGYYVIVRHKGKTRTWGPFNDEIAARMEDMFQINGLPEAETPGQGDEPADSKKARALANATLKSKAPIALAFRQLWRHKYIKKNYDAGKAWKIFYWLLTHGGAGGKGYNPATRKAASKLLVSAFGKWAKAGMKVTVPRADGKEEKPVGAVSRAEFIRWFTSSAPAITEAEDLKLVTAKEGNVTFRTGKAVTFRFLHNDEKSVRMGARFQQDIEPAGYYVTTAPDEKTVAYLKKHGRYTTGTMTFRKPLVLDWGKSYDENSWKARLQRQYGAKGKALTRALLQDGYDGIVTVVKGAPREIVALKSPPQAALDEVTRADAARSDWKAIELNREAEAKAKKKRKKKLRQEFVEDQLDEAVKLVRDLAETGWQVVHIGHIGWFNVYTATEFDEATLRNNRDKLGDKAYEFNSTVHEYKTYRKDRSLFVASTVLKDPQSFVAGIKEATAGLQQLGFPRQRTVLVLRDLTGKTTRMGGAVAGTAHREAHGITISTKDFEVGSILHEWAHMYWFRLPKKSRAYFNRWYEENVLRTVEKALERAPTSTEITDIVNLLGTLVNEGFQRRWGMDLREYMKQRREADRFANQDEAVLAVVLDRLTERRDLELHGELLKELKPSADSTAKPRDRVAGSDVVLYPDTDPKSKKAGVFTKLDVAFIAHIPLSRVLDYIKVDWAATQAGNRNLDLAAIRYRMTKLRQPLEKAFENAMKAELDEQLYGTTATLYLKRWNLVPIEVFPPKVFALVLKDFLAAAKKAQNGYVPSLAIKRYLHEQGIWKPSEKTRTDVAASISGTEGDAIRAIARHGGKTPSAYGAGSAVELWAETVRYATTSRVSKELKRALRNVMSGDVSESLAASFVAPRRSEMSKLTEAFVHEQEPEEEPEKSDVEKDQEKADEIGYELKDVQAYYDLQIAQGLDQGAALVRVKRKFKLKKIKVSPIGKILAPTIPDPTGKKKKAPPPPPPEEEPEEEPEGEPEGEPEEEPEEEPKPPPKGKAKGRSMAGGKFPEGPKGASKPTGPKQPVPRGKK